MKMGTKFCCKTSENKENRHEILHANREIFNCSESVSRSFQPWASGQSDNLSPTTRSPAESKIVGAAPSLCSLVPRSQSGQPTPHQSSRSIFLPWMFRPCRWLITENLISCLSCMKLKMFVPDKCSCRRCLRLKTFVPEFHATEKFRA